MHYSKLHPSSPRLDNLRLFKDALKMLRLGRVVWIWAKRLLGSYFIAGGGAENNIWMHMCFSYSSIELHGMLLIVFMSSLSLGFIIFVNVSMCLGQSWRHFTRFLSFVRHHWSVFFLSLFPLRRIRQLVNKVQILDTKQVLLIRTLYRTRINSLISPFIYMKKSNGLPNLRRKVLSDLTHIRLTY